MNTPVIVSPSPARPGDLLCVGTTARGKGDLSMGQQLRADQVAQHRARGAELHQAEMQRLNAVREAFWTNTPKSHEDLACIREAMATCGIEKSPTMGQLRTAFMLIPPDILGSALSWGFAGTEVREDLMRFLEEERQAIREATKA